jgi:spermidine synthase
MSYVEPTQHKWLHDYISPDMVQLHSIRKVLFSGQTSFQAVDILELGSFGLCLVLDGKIQSSERDEFIYHESLVHPVMLAHPDPRRILVIGGGEGASLREVLVHRTVERVTMVDIDEEVVNVCRRFLSSFHRGSFDDTRVELCFADAREFLSRSDDKFDVIIVDLADPVEGGPACLLYTREFYQLVRNRLADGGIAVVQSEPAGWLNGHFAAINNTLKIVFPLVSPYQVYIPSFVDLWGFTSVSLNVDPAVLSPQEINRRISDRLTKQTRSYDGDSHRAMFSLPKHLREGMAKVETVISDSDPVFIYRELLD